VRILILAQRAPYLPTHDRGRLAAASLLSQLGRHTVAVVTVSESGDTAVQRAWPSSVAERVVRVPAGRGRHVVNGGADGLASLRAAAQQTAAEFLPDVIHVDGAGLAPLAGALPAPAIVNVRDSAVRRARDAQRHARTATAWIRARLDERMAAAWERRWLLAAHTCVVASEPDRAALVERVAPGAVDVIPPGVDEARYAFRRGAESARMVFAGNLGWPAHLAAARRLAMVVLPKIRRALPRAELLLIGSGPEAALRSLATVPGVRVAGAAADLRPSLWSATLALLPTEAGPAVDAAALEAMALGTPLVAARECLAGLTHVLPGHHVAAADTEIELAEAALLVLREPVVAATLAANARQVVERHYTWAAIARRYEALWARAAEGAAVAA
jgi:glycosyltransferase involved in cell wall biosynthesis